MFERETFIPLDALTKVGRAEVFVNVPRLFVAKMPWNESPTSATRQEKLGAPRDEVVNLYGSRSPSVNPSGSQP